MNAPTASFLYVSCQIGAEPAVKREFLERRPEARFAFSLPGFLTFRDTPPAEGEPDPIPSTFARNWGRSRGFLDEADPAERRAKLLEKLREIPADRIHVWPRDERKPGEWDYVPGPNPAGIALREELAALDPRVELPTSGLPPIQPGERVTDVVLLSDKRWFVGTKVHSREHLPWPGGLSDETLPEYAVSRAYLKLQQGLAWSRLPVRPGQLVCELGSSPGGAAQALLERGLRVMGVDPGEMDPKVVAHPKFRHIQRRSPNVPKALFHPATWLFADMNVTPTYTLDSVEEIVKLPAGKLLGLLLTLKLSDWEMAEYLHKFVERVRGWGFDHIRTRQLQQHRQEVALTARRKVPWGQSRPEEYSE